MVRVDLNSDWCVIELRALPVPRLHNEFPELVASTTADAGPVTIVEIGCGRHSYLILAPPNPHHHLGAGNSVFPLLSANKNPALSLHAYDYANHAVKLVQVPI